MSDTRATERLLEVVEQAAEELNRDVARDLRSRVAVIGAAATELRRRGDTLVRRRDLELVIQALGRERLAFGEDESQALERLDGALGGVL
ncbi:MAG TPA: hypothetical protein VGO31_01775 [Microbacteriaceae bacterium]|jgi:hypothetical protein|nr:hypothetical protein [Microbacteriaceae bacterium]